MAKRKNSLIFILPALAAICAINCAWQAKVFYPDAFQTGAVLDKGRNEISVNLPANISIGHGFTTNRLETRLMLGASGTNVGGIGIEINKSVASGQRFMSSLGIKPELIFNGEENFAGLRGILTFAVGYRWSEHVCLFLPIKGSFSQYDHKGAKAQGFSFIPGCGISVEGKHWVLRLGGNIPIPSTIALEPNDVWQLPYGALQVSYRP